MPQWRTMLDFPLKLRDLRSSEYGIRDSFEEFCCQILRRAPEVPANSRYRRVRGVGGDGGVEAFGRFRTAKSGDFRPSFSTRLAPSKRRSWRNLWGRRQPIIRASRT